MDLAPFLLDRWLAEHEFADPAIRYNLASSAGPVWRLGELLALAGSDIESLADTALTYAPPAGDPALRAAIGAFLDVDPEWVVVTTGASEALSIMLCLAAAPGSAIAAPDPGYPAVEVLARAWGLAVRRYALSRVTGFAQRATQVMAAVDGTTRLALVTSPHNPTGSVMADEEIATLAAMLADRDCLMVVDEVYHPLRFDAPARSAARQAGVVAIGDMSKALSLPGLRIGWIVDRDAARRERIIDARSYFTISGSPLTERIAAVALGAGTGLIDRLRSTAAANLATLTEWLQHDADVDWVRPSGGPVAFPWFSDGRDARPFCERLAASGVLVVPGDCFGMPEHFRVGLGSDPADFRAAIVLIEQARL